MIQNFLITRGPVSIEGGGQIFYTSTLYKKKYPRAIRYGGFRLVSCFRNKYTKSFDLFQDRIRCCGPNKGTGIGNPQV